MAKGQGAVLTAVDTKYKEEVLNDFRIARISREVSLMGRREVLSGKAKFGIFGDGKEVAQLAMAKQFKNGDFRSGYYRDQTFMMAIGALTVKEYFAALYAHTDVDKEPASGGRRQLRRDCPGGFGPVGRRGHALLRQDRHSAGRKRSGPIRSR